jgi:hypothetical protein
MCDAQAATLDMPPVSLAPLLKRIANDIVNQRTALSV